VLLAHAGCPHSSLAPIQEPGTTVFPAGRTKPEWTPGSVRRRVGRIDKDGQPGPPDCHYGYPKVTRSGHPVRIPG